MTQNYRNTDPHTSREGGLWFEATKGMGHREIVRSFVERYPHRTARELQQLMTTTTGLASPSFTKRLPECEREGSIVKGRVRKCTITHRSAHEWKPANLP